ncbi:MAG: rhodanese-related sulfurtransferase [Arenicella sp.]|jgi:rhodanese-related sulfurtransferase
MKTLRLLLLAATFVAINVSLAQSDMPNLEQQDSEKQIAKRVSKEVFKAKLKTIKNVQLIDVRTPNEFNEGTIEGAKNIDYNSKSFKTQIGQLDKSKATFIFCHSGGRSSQALRQFKALGFEYVLELEGGYSKYNK